MKAGKMSRAYSTPGTNGRRAQNSDRKILKTPLGDRKHIGINIEMQGPFVWAVLCRHAQDTSEDSRLSTDYAEQWPGAADCK